MRAFLIKILKAGVPVALLSAAVGYGLASLAGPFADAQAAQAQVPGELPSSVMKVRLPLLMAGACLAAVAAWEALGALVRSRRAAPATTPVPKGQGPSASGMDAEVEALLNQILAQTEREARPQTPSAADPAWYRW